VRTGPAVIAFGFVIEKFNLFVLAIASSTSAEAAHRLQLESLSAGLSRSGGRHHSVTVGAIISLWWAASPGISNLIS
jgi:putative membrane protein